MKAIQIQAHGGAEVLNYSDISQPNPDPGQVLIQIEAAGVNYIDTYQRSGLYPVELPYVMGMEGAGRIVELGEGVQSLSIGSRVAFCGVSGAYAEYAVVPSDRVVSVPEGLEAPEAAALMLQGMTAHYLTHSTFKLQPGSTCLVHAAAGGVGLLLVQMAKLAGARIIGTVSTEEKAALAADAGVDEIILYTQQDFQQEVMRITDNAGVDVVYDSVGQTTYEASMNCLKRRSMLVLYGQSSGKVPPIDPHRLTKGGSLFLTRPTLADYISERESLEERTNDIFSWFLDGSLRTRIAAVFPLAEASAAHQALESRKTSGKLLLNI